MCLWRIAFSSLRPNPARGAVGERRKMSATRILDGLERSTATGAEADTVARLGFLEWAFGLEGEATPNEARMALATPGAQRPGSAAACAFVSFLHQATQPISRRACRRGRKRALH